MKTSRLPWITASSGVRRKTSSVLAAVLLAVSTLSSGCDTTEESRAGEREDGIWVDENGDELRPGDLDRDEWINRNRPEARRDREDRTW